MLPAIATDSRAAAHHAAAAAVPGPRTGASTSDTPASPSAAPRTTTSSIKGNLISRLHARIEINRNKFVLIDQSTNGTFVQSADGEESFVRRDSLQIKGEGMIGLGRLPEQDSPQTIRFNCEEV